MHTREKIPYTHWRKDIVTHNHIHKYTHTAVLVHTSMFQYIHRNTMHTREKIPYAHWHKDIVTHNHIHKYTHTAVLVHTSMFQYIHRNTMHTREKIPYAHWHKDIVTHNHIHKYTHRAACTLSTHSNTHRREGTYAQKHINAHINSHASMKEKNTRIQWYRDIDTLRYVSYLPNPSARTGYDTRSIFKRSLTGLISEFSFS